MRMFVWLISLICLAIAVVLAITIFPDIKDYIETIKIAFKLSWKKGIVSAVEIFGQIILFFSVGFVGLFGGKRD